jgi:hypothetical protein
LRTYLEAAWRDGQAPFDPSILVCSALLIPRMTNINHMKMSCSQYMSFCSVEI